MVISGVVTFEQPSAKKTRGALRPWYHSDPRLFRNMALSRLKRDPKSVMSRTVFLSNKYE